MSKAAEARVRDELLQTLYSHALRCTLAAAAGGRSADDAAPSAGIFANLLPDDTILLPPRTAAGLRILCGLSRVPARGSVGRDRAMRVYPLPRNEAQAVAFCLAMGLAAADTPAPSGGGNSVVVVLPAAVRLSVSHAKSQTMPSDWSDAAAYAARAALPVLFVSIENSPPGWGSAAGAPADPSQPAPLFPSIPVDRDDALAVYRVAYECLGRARAGGGPSHLAAAHCPALPGGASGGALRRLEAMLRRRGCFSKAWQRALEREITREIAQRP
jgi:hypothetical protein